MKQLFSILLLLQTCIIIKAQEITNVNDARLPADVKNKISTLLNPDDLENFKYTDSKVFQDTGFATMQETIALSFVDGKISGTITTRKSQIGFQEEQHNYTVNICFLYCCIDETGHKDCTTDFNIYKIKKQGSACKKKTSKPCN